MSLTELELIAVRDPDSMARFYTGHIAAVKQFCEAVCAEGRVDQAVEAAMANFLTRAAETPAGVTPEDLLRKATQESAAARMDPDDLGAEPDAPISRAMPELLAARANGELPGEVGPILEHLWSCRVCETTAARLDEAGVAFATWPVGEREARRRWLQLADIARHRGAPGAAPAQVQPQAPAEQAVGFRRRYGGIVGGVRQFARSRAGGQADLVAAEHRP